LDYAGGGGSSGHLVTTFSGATGQPIHTYRTTLGGLGWRIASGVDLAQDGVNDLFGGAPGNWAHALSGRDRPFLYSCNQTDPSGSEMGEVALLAPPPGEQYPILVYSEPTWIGPPPHGSGIPGVLWAVRGSPPGVRAFGAGDASANLAVPRIGMRDLTG